MNRVYRTLADITVYEATATEIGDLKRKSNHNRYFEREILPEFCVRDDNNGVTRSDYYLQWVEEGEDKYILFDVSTYDKLLGEEISNTGFEDLVKGFDFRFLLQNFRKQKLDEKYQQLHPSEYLIIDLIYSGYREDVDLDVEVVGKLNLNNLED